MKIEERIVGMFPSPVRGSSFLYTITPKQSGGKPWFPSPIGEVVSYILDKLFENLDFTPTFPSPIGEVVSYMVVLGQLEDELNNE